MDEISTYSISRLQKAFELATRKTDYFYVGQGKDPLYNDEPFRTETYTILLLKKGCMHLQADLTHFTINAPAVLTIGPNVTRSFQQCEGETEILIFFFTDSFLLETRANIFYLNKYRFFENNDRHFLVLNEHEMGRLSAIFDLIAATYNKDHPNELVLMRSYSYLLIHEVDAMHKNRTVVVSKTDDQSSIFIRFRNLLTKEFWRHRSVSFYADNLNVTPKYLSELIKKQTGKTAGEWIDRAVILEAKILLQNKELGISQVSDQLNFSDQSVFGKFFKTHEGISPLEYRKRL